MQFRLVRMSSPVGMLLTTCEGWHDEARRIEFVAVDFRNGEIRTFRSVVTDHVTSKKSNFVDPILV